MSQRPLTVAWFSFFPVEWLPDPPEPLRNIPKLHPASWQRVLYQGLENNPAVRLHIVVLRKHFASDFTFERNGVTFHLVKVPGGWRAPTLFWLDTFLIRRVLQKVKPDVVHAWGTEQGAALVAKRLGYPRIVTVQGLLNWYGKLVPQVPYEKLAAFLERYSLERSPLVTTEARFSKQWVQQHHPRTRVEQVEHAPDPVFHRLERRPQTQPLRFLFVGALDYRKGGDLTALALDRLRKEIPLELIVLGKRHPSVAATLDHKVSSEFWKQVTFKQNLTHHEVAAELSQATMLLGPSRADVSPNAVKEAVAAGVPVVGTSVGGIPDYVLPGLNGFLCAPDRLEDLVEAIRAAARHPQFSRGEVDAPTLVRMRAYLSPELMAKRFLEVYHLALEQR
jgi:glycosyltransferase involved in cell wall biosynthesis